MYLKLYFTFIVLFVIFNVSTAGIAVTRPNKGHPNKCWDGAREYSVGAHQMEGSCAQFVCGSDFLGELQMCGLATVNGKLTLPDLSKKYPECCPGR